MVYPNHIGSHLCRIQNCCLSCTGYLLLQRNILGIKKESRSRPNPSSVGRFVQGLPNEPLKLNAFIRIVVWLSPPCKFISYIAPGWKEAQLVTYNIFFSQNVSPQGSCSLIGLKSRLSIRHMKLGHSVTPILIISCTEALGHWFK